MKHVSISELILVGAATAWVSLAPGISKAVAQQPQAALVAQSRFDGTYSVDAIPAGGAGTCRASHWTVTVADGQIASISPNPTNITALGLIEADGVISLTFRDSQNQIAHIGGSVRGRRGKGTWSSPTLLCGGVWHAEREK
ncbi:MAG: hypothetical protein ACYC5H_10185 [Methylovirgula sp.]